MGDHRLLSGPADGFPDPAAELGAIREALLDLCLERGYPSVTLPLLLERSGTTQPAFERHYEDLESCLCAVYVEARDDLFGRVREAIADQPSWRDRIRTTAYVFLRFLREDRRVAHLSVVDIRSGGERAQLLFGQAAGQLFDLLDQGRQERSDPEAISRATAEAIGGGIFAQIYAAVDSGAPLRADGVPRLMHAAVLPYLGERAAEAELDLPLPDPSP